ncbi:MAG: hypothetical protein IKN11_03840 [Bacteroidales bacterium]|nr:hypothetical protein [Bacteroidales bacterium]
MENELLEKALRGYYRTGCFHMYLAGCFDPDLIKMSRADLGTFLHEYVHFLQNISTPYGIFKASTYNEAAVETFIDIEPKDEIELPYDAPQSRMLKGRLEWLKIMDGQHINNSDEHIQVDDNKKILWGVTKQSIVGREGRLVALEFYDKAGKTHHRFIGARDIKEAMAVAYQSLIDTDAMHPDIPYNLLRIFCNQTFPTVGNDVKKFICLCYTALFSLEPAYHFISLCHKAEDEKEKTGFQFFDEYLTDHKIMVRGKKMTVWEHFNGMLKQYRQSIEGLIRCEMPYINSLLESVRLENGNVPLLNVINTDIPFSVDNVQALVSACGIPYMHAQNRGWFFPSMDGEGASDVVKLVGDTWLYQFLINRDEMKKCVCPLVTICGQKGTYCYDQPWLERNCTFELLGNEIGLKDKKIIIKKG